MVTRRVLQPDAPLLKQAKVQFLDATYLHRAPAERNAYQEFLTRRLPGARFWSLEDVSEPHPKGFKLMLPSPARFQSYVQTLGIERDTIVVLYDTLGTFSAPRALFTFAAYNHPQVYILDGGLPAALKSGLWSTESGTPELVIPSHYPLTPIQETLIASYQDIVSRNTEENTLVDARSSEDFALGCMPNSISLPWRELLEYDIDGISHLPQGEVLEKKLARFLGSSLALAVLEGRQSIISSCGGGLSACILWLAFEERGVSAKVYDESWNGWSLRAKQGDP